MTDKEKSKAFDRERAVRLKAKIAIQRDTAEEVRRLLKKADADIAAKLKAAPSDYQKFHLTELQREVRRAMAELEPDAAKAMTGGLDRAWDAGQQLIDAPLSAAGIDMTGALVRLDTRQLMSMRSFMTDRVKDITAKLANRINGELGAVAIGTQSPFEAAKKVSGIIDGGMKRAHVLVRTELGRAYSTAAQERQAQAVKRVPGMKKQWRRSGKLHSRYEHDIIDGQVRDIDKPFDLPNGVKLMYPRDPAGPVEETINCGCTSLPFMASWEVAQPGRRPFSDDEVAASRLKRDIESGF